MLPSIDYCFEQTCRQSLADPAAAGPASASADGQPSPASAAGRLGPAATASYVDQTATAAAWPAAPEGPDWRSGRAQDVTASAYLTEGRGGGGGCGEGEGEEERDEEGRGANDMVSWRHLLLRALRYMQGHLDYLIKVRNRGNQYTQHSGVYLNIKKKSKYI